jgi:hypothetical protein
MKTPIKEKKAFDKHSCEFKNEKECEDELEEEDVSLEKAEEEEFIGDEE